jgi:hypothetical protein
MKQGRLDLAPIAGQTAASTLQLAWKDGRAVVWAKVGPYGNLQSQPLDRIDRAAFVGGVRRLADRQVEAELNYFAVDVLVWTDKHGGVPPAASELRPGTAFARWLDRAYQGQYVWRTNPFTGMPIKEGREPGDFTYAVAGNTWTLRGHLSTGRTFDARNP